MPAAPKPSKLAASIPDGTERHVRNHKPNGRFAEGNKASAGSHWRAEIRKQLGVLAADDETRRLANEAQYLFRCLMRDMPVDGAGVSALVASRARATVLAAWFAAESARVGMTSDRGMKLLDTSMKLDARAERLAVTAIELAGRQHKAKKQDAVGLAGLGELREGAKGVRGKHTPPLLVVGGPDPTVRDVTPDPESDKE